MSRVSFRDLDGGEPIEGMSALEKWYKSIRDVPIDGLELDDVCVAVRQKLFLQFVLPVALRYLQNDPLSGELYDGELAKAVAGLPSRYWPSEPGLKDEAKRILRLQDYSSYELAQPTVEAFLHAT